MQGSQSTGQDFAHLKELIENIEIAMLTTTDTDGTLRSRPLQTVGVEDDGTLWFFTSQSSPKVARRSGRESESQYVRQRLLCTNHAARPDGVTQGAGNSAMADISSAAETGFTRCLAMPAPALLWRSCSSPYPVSAIMRGAAAP
jgi:hypothetical protein